MEMFLALRSPAPAKAGVKKGALQTQKAAGSAMEPQLQRLMKPQPINALSALRDGVPCSERLWWGGCKAPHSWIERLCHSRGRGEPKLGRGGDA
jgi:hypothetical protein